MLLVVGPALGAAGGSSFHTSAAAPAATITDQVSSTLTLSGATIAGHTTDGTALSTSLSSPWTAVFQWTTAPGTAALVTKGEIEILFFGAPIGTSTEQLSGATPMSSGTITLSSDFTSYHWLIAGTYEMSGLLYSNSTLLWQSNFYVTIQATDHITVINIALILIALYEIYQIAMLGSARAIRRQIQDVKMGGGMS